MNKENAVVTVDVNPTKSSSSLLKIDPSNIRVIEGFNVRQDYGDIEELADSILENGQFEPIIVSKVKGEDQYELIEGHRRLAAINRIRERGQEFPYIVATTNTMSAEERIFAMLVTGSTKKNLTTLEQAEAIKRLINKHYSTDDIAKKMGKSVSHVNQLLELAAAPKELKDMVKDGDIAATTAVQMVREIGEDAVVEVVRDAIAEAKADAGGEVVTTNGKKKRVAAATIKEKAAAKGVVKTPAAKKTPSMGNFSILIDAVMDAVRDINPESNAMTLLDDMLVEFAEAQADKRIPSVEYLAKSFIRNCK